jgi:outer membrane protein
MRRLLVFLIPFLIPDSAHPQIVFHSLPEVLTAALRDNPTQHIYRLKTGQLTADYHASQSYLYPQVAGTISGQDNLKLSVTPVPGAIINQPGKTLYLTFGKHYVYNAGVNATENLFNWQYVFQSNIARENISLNNLQQAAYEQNLKASTAQYYFSGLIAASSIKISTRDLQIADSIFNTVKNRYTQGLVDLSAVHSAEINVNDVQENILQSRQLLDQAIQNLKLLIGCAAQQTLTLDENLVADSISTDLPTGASAEAGAPSKAGPTPAIGPDKNLDVYAANTHLAELQAKFQKAAFYPTLALSGFLGSEQFRDNFGLTFGDQTWNDYRYLQLNLNVPLFTGFYTRDKYRSAQALARINAQQYHDAVEEGKITDSLLINTYDNDRLLVATSGRNLLLYRANVDLSRQKFEEGLISIDTFQKTFEDYLRAENTHLNNVSSMFSAMATIISRN